MSFKYYEIDEGYVAVDVAMSDDETYDYPIEEGSEETPDSWGLKTKAQAVGLSVVRCSKCKKVAVQVDGHYPYYEEYNRCEENKE